jgi:alpha-mannosidase
LEKFQQLKFSKVKIIAEGPVRASLQTEVKYGQSTILITVDLRSDSALGRA